MSKVFNPDMAVIGDFLGAVGQERQSSRRRRWRCTNPRRRSRPSSIRTRAPTSSSPFGQEGVELEEGYLTLTSLPGGLLMKVGKMRARSARSTDAQPRAAVDRSAARVTQPGRRRRGHRRRGISVSRLIPNPWFFLEATGQVYRGRVRDLPRADAERPELRRPPARVPRHLREHEPRSRRVVSPTGTTTPRTTATTRLVGVDATFRWRPLRRSIYHRFLGRTELVWSRREQPAPDFTAQASATTRPATTSSRGAGSAALRYDWSERATNATQHDRGPVVPADVLAERVQPGARPVPAHRTTPRAITANEFLFQFQFSIGAHGAHPF